jgi:hypothetical protein
MSPIENVTSPQEKEKEAKVIKGKKPYFLEHGHGGDDYAILFKITSHYRE